MFSQFKLGAKIIIYFILVIVVTGGVLAGLGYFNITQLSGIISEITDQRVPSIQHATSVERYALRTILDEKQYIVALSDDNVDEATFHRSAMSNIDEINRALDNVDKVANQYNDKELLSKSQEVRTVTAQYKDLYNSTAAKYQENNKLAQTMADSGTTVTDLAREFFNSKAGKTDTQTMQQLPILIDIWETALNTRIDQNKYMRTRDVQNWQDLQDRITKLGQRYNDLEAVSVDAADISKIKEARTATDAYFAAAQAWGKAIFCGFCAGERYKNRFMFFFPFWEGSGEGIFDTCPPLNPRAGVEFFGVVLGCAVIVHPKTMHLLIRLCHCKRCGQLLGERGGCERRSRHTEQLKVKKGAGEKLQCFYALFTLNLPHIYRRGSVKYLHFFY